MKQKYNKKDQKPTRPFEGMMKQLNKETLVLCNLNNFEGFKKALNDAGIEYDLGDFYRDGVIVLKR